jgi:hypothetical protein
MYPSDLTINDWSQRLSGDDLLRIQARYLTCRIIEEVASYFDEGKDGFVSIMSWDTGAIVSIGAIEAQAIAFQSTPPKYALAIDDVYIYAERENDLYTLPTADELQSVRMRLAWVAPM